MTITTDPRLIRKKGLEALMKALGPGGMMRFLQQYGNGEGDYSKQRARLQNGETVKSLMKKIQKRRNAGEGDYSQRRAKMQEGMTVKKLGKEIRKRRKAA